MRMKHEISYFFLIISPKHTHVAAATCAVSCCGVELSHRLHFGKSYTVLDLDLIYLISFTAPTVTWLTCCWTCRDSSQLCCMGRFRLFHHQPPSKQPWIQIMGVYLSLSPRVGFWVRGQGNPEESDLGRLKLNYIFFHCWRPWRIQLVRPPCSSSVLVRLGTISINYVYIKKPTLETGKMYTDMKNATSLPQALPPDKTT